METRVLLGMVFEHDDRVYLDEYNSRTGMAGSGLVGHRPVSVPDRGTLSRSAILAAEVEPHRLLPLRSAADVPASQATGFMDIERENENIDRARENHDILVCLDIDTFLVSAVNKYDLGLWEAVPR